jgi:hypothetical protein
MLCFTCSDRLSLGFTSSRVAYNKIGIDYIQPRYVQLLLSSMHMWH